MEFRTHPVYSKYSASREGLIKGPHKLLKQTVAGNGYGRVQIGHRGPIRAAHCIIWECFHGLIPTGLTINHLNGVKLDNRLCNLECVTQKENNEHAWRLGLSKPQRGERQPHAKLTESKVVEIIDAFKNGVTRKELAERDTLYREML